VVVAAAVISFGARDLSSATTPHRVRVI